MAHKEDGCADKKFICSEEKSNIFLIGDSIRMGYCEVVKEKLADVANVFYVDDNCRNTQYVITKLYEWSNRFDSPENVNLVQFNCGHWDVAHWQNSEYSLTSENEYERNIELIITLIRKLFCNARIVFITTTAMNPNGMVGVNPRTNDEIERYNMIAKKVANTMGIIVNDIYQYVCSWDSDCYSDYAHFTDSSYENLGNEIAHRLKQML